MERLHSDAVRKSMGGSEQANMNKSILVTVFGFPATLIHGDPLVMDRWMWLRRRLPRTANGETLVDIGCGSGAFTIGAGLRGYTALGLSWDERNQRVAQERAQLCRAANVTFAVADVRRLSEQADLRGRFDVALCCENIEHILDDKKLMCDIANCLKPGGRLLLTAPNHYYRPISREDLGPFLPIENGAHVRRGYTYAMLDELCRAAGLVCEERSSCSGLLSQKIAGLQRWLGKLHPAFAWITILPLRIAPPILDRVIGVLTRWPNYSVCITAYKPRFGRA
jgi:2-polyprenyl-3-methyl-5-hydroxy-6-metoxy-1,4-benzoquinol methylase